jgi:predicted esterase
MKWPRTFAWVALAWLVFSVGSAQTNEPATAGKTPKVLQPEVSFLSEEPVIDGVLDPCLKFLPARPFTTIGDQKSESAPTISYRLAYGTRFFYVYIEAQAPRLVFRDRAYQNGDGFVMLLARPQPNDKATDEFYELACSAVNKPGLEWSRHFFWNYNVDKLFLPTSDDTKMEFREEGGKISFELLLPWADVRPYHPWLSKGIGFNLTFTKALEPSGRKRFRVVDDDATGGEFKKRLYTTLKFETPTGVVKPQMFVGFVNGHLTEGDSLRGYAATVSGKEGGERLSLRVVSGEGRTILYRRIDYACAPGVSVKEFAVGTAQLAEGGYTVTWRSQGGSSRGSSGLSVLRAFDPVELNRRLDNTGSTLPASTISTLHFLIQELHDNLMALRSYEICASERLRLASLMRMMNSAERGIDPLAERTGFVRKAYRSKVDGTFQPYVVYLPGEVDRAKKYPLLVYLHGSASDETNIEGLRSFIPPGYIAVGPFGRGPSNGYSRDHAQDDIAEAIAAVERDYPIDTTRIVLFGFSMGGYGVYRTFYETPWKFRALAVFSGGPDLGAQYATGSNPPDFTQERNLRSFRNIPIFIFHGEKDMNVPIAATRGLVRKLQEVGARVELRVEADKGHETPSDEGIEAFKAWLKNVLANGPR